MHKSTVYTLTKLEKILPYLGILPFGYFIYDAYGRIRQSIIQDAKLGHIKSAFISVWLKNIAVDEVILKNTQIRQDTLNTLQNVVTTPIIKQAGLEFAIKLAYTQPVISEIMNMGNDLSKTIVLEDEDSKEDVSQSAQESNPLRQNYDSIMNKMSGRMFGSFTR